MVQTTAPFFYLQICSTPIWWRIHFLRSTVSPAEGFILSYALTRMTTPSAEGAFSWDASADAEAISPLRRRPKDGARLAAFRSPFGNLRPITLATMRQPTLAGRGGSVSRRDHNQAYRRPHPPHRRNHPCRSTHAKRHLLFGRGGLGERRFSQRSGLSPRISPTVNLFGREREGGGFSSEKPPPSQSLTSRK